VPYQRRRGFTKHPNPCCYLFASDSYSEIASIPAMKSDLDSVCGSEQAVSLAEGGRRLLEVSKSPYRPIRRPSHRVQRSIVVILSKEQTLLARRC